MKSIHLLLLVIAISFTACTPKEAVKGVKLSPKMKILQGRWNCDKMMKEEKEVNFKKLIGDIMMKFNEDNFTMMIAGQDQTFKYTVRNDSIVFTNAVDYPGLKIINLDKNILVADQYYSSENYTIRWFFSPYKGE